MASSHEPTSPDIATLNERASKARFGVAYLRCMCSHAGLGFKETSPDEDVLAVDGDVDFPVGPVRVQVKCSGQFRIQGGRTATWDTKPAWRKKWEKSLTPVYFILVIVDPDVQQNWVIHQDDSTLLSAAAFWVRVDRVANGHSITIPKDQRLTVQTFTQWAQEVEDCYAPLEITEGSDE